MATDRAATIATTIHSSLIHKPSRGKPLSRQASSAPVSAKGQREDGVLELDHLERQPDSS
jgi:hypothetical protein